YRKDIIGDDPPKTWDDVFRLMKKYKGKTKYGFVARGAKGNPVVTNFAPVLWSTGGRIFDDDWHVTINDKKGVAALKLYMKLVKASPNGVANYDSSEVGNTMAQGKALMSIVWPAWAHTMETESKSKVAGKIGYSLVPKGTEYAPELGNWLLAIPKGSEHKKAAFKFIKWATSKKVQTKMAAEGGVPVRKSVLTDPKLVKKHPYLPAVKKGLENARWRPRTPLWSKMEHVLGTYLNLAVAGQMAPQEALDKAAKELEKVLKANGYAKE
ncbi:MAG TPA: extracellular solute-binding protein, partial [Bacillales bacterium]|nr:extracellular solute-binding protein [Bacillales bacterium]